MSPQSLDESVCPDRRRIRRQFTVLLALVLASLGQLFALEPPVSLDASDGDYARKIGLNWDAVRGATRYRIFRGVTMDPASAQEVGVTSAGFFFDSEPEWVDSAAAFFYFVRSENDNEVSELSQPDHGHTLVGDPSFEGLGPLGPPPAPPENPITAAKAFLGKILFWDEQLSSTDTVACGTCHRPSAGGTDPRVARGVTMNPGADSVLGTFDDPVGSPGIPLVRADGTYEWHPVFGFGPQVGPRLPRTVINAAYGRDLMWDGRATDEFVDPQHGTTTIPTGGGLESQAVLPLFNTFEMGHIGRTWQDIIDKLEAVRPLALSADRTEPLDRFIAGRSYGELFEEVFGSSEINAERILMAIATYERTQFSDRTDFDRAVQGIEDLAFQQELGLNTMSRADCDVCHLLSGSLDNDRAVLTDGAFHFIGVRPPEEDAGRFAETRDEQDLGRFQTPTLRNVGLRPSFFHEGSFDSMLDVINFYTRGGDFDAPNLAPEIVPNNLAPIERLGLSLFLSQSLTDSRVEEELPPFDRPKLSSEIECLPALEGQGAVGSGGLEPQIVALEPSMLGNPDYTVALHDALGGAQATLIIDEAPLPEHGPAPPTGSFFYGSLTLEGSGAGAGHGSLNVELPTAAVLEGLVVFGRWYVDDPAAEGGLASSRQIEISLFSAYPRDLDSNGRIDACSGVTALIFRSDFESGDLGNWIGMTEP